jgi:hypothetical protein
VAEQRLRKTGLERKRVSDRDRKLNALLPLDPIDDDRSIATFVQNERDRGLSTFASESRGHGAQRLGPVEGPKRSVTELDGTEAEAVLVSRGPDEQPVGLQPS